MPTTIDMDSVGKLSVKERLQLLEAIWATLVDADQPFPEEVIAEMERRAAEARANPDKGMTLEEFKKRARELRP